MLSESPIVNGRLRWAWFLEWVIVPCTGLALAIFGSLSGRIGPEWIPVITGFALFPFARTLDRLRKNGK